MGRQARDRAATTTRVRQKRWRDPRWTRAGKAAKFLLGFGGVLALLWVILTLWTGPDTAFGWAKVIVIFGGVPLALLLLNMVNPWLKECPTCHQTWYGSWSSHNCN